MLSAQEWILVVFIAVTLVIIVFDLLRPDLTAILVLAILPLTGLVTFEEALSGFSRSVVITIIGLFVITQALEDVGAVQWIAEQLKQVGKGSEMRLILLFMGTGATLSLIMNNIAAGAVLLPAAVQVGRESDVAPSKLLIPLSFGTLVGGMATYFTTANDGACLGIGSIAWSMALPVNGGQNNVGRFMKNVLDAFVKPGPLPGGAHVGEEKLWR